MLHWPRPTSSLFALGSHSPLDSAPGYSEHPSNLRLASLLSDERRYARQSLRAPLDRGSHLNWPIALGHIHSSEAPLSHINH